MTVPETVATMRRMRRALLTGRKAMRRRKKAQNWKNQWRILADWTVARQ